MRFQYEPTDVLALTLLALQERELEMTMREAKAAFDVEKFRAWKRAKKRSNRYEGA